MFSLTSGYASTLQERVGISGNTWWRLEEF